MPPYQAAWGVVNGETQTVVSRAATAMPAWQQTNASGFGTTNADEVSALAVFGSDLYAGTSSPPTERGSSAPRTAPRGRPSQSRGSASRMTSRRRPSSTCSSSGPSLYASTGRGDGQPRVAHARRRQLGAYGHHRFPATPTQSTSPRWPNSTALICAGAANRSPARRSGAVSPRDNNSWTQVAPAAPGTEVARITSMAEFDGASTRRSIHRGTGATLAEFRQRLDDGGRRRLVTAARPPAEAWLHSMGISMSVPATTSPAPSSRRTNDDVTWDQVITPGFENPNNQQVDQVFIFESTSLRQRAQSVGRSSKSGVRPMARRESSRACELR